MKPDVVSKAFLIGSDETSGTIFVSSAGIRPWMESIFSSMLRWWSRTGEPIPSGGAKVGSGWVERWRLLATVLWTRLNGERTTHICVLVELWLEWCRSLWWEVCFSRDLVGECFHWHFYIWPHGDTHNNKKRGGQEQHYNKYKYFRNIQKAKMETTRSKIGGLDMLVYEARWPLTMNASCRTAFDPTGLSVLLASSCKD